MSDILGQSGKKSNWRAVSRSEPCPKCGKPDNCKISEDGSAVFCGRIQSNIPPNAGGQWLHRLNDGDTYSHPVLGDAPPTKLQNESTAKDSTYWTRNADFFVEQGDDKLHILAQTLGVDEGVLRRLKVGLVLSPRLRIKEWWAFPEKDAQGKFIGIVRRPCGGDKKLTIKGSKRGIIYVDDWHKTPGPIYLVEGASDTAAMMTMGFCAIGRPSARGGIYFLAELLSHHPDREIVVLGERDQKEETGLWEGRDGAISTAKQLAERLDRAINWGLPPEGFKDFREYLNGPVSKPPWTLELEVIEPPPPPEPFQPPTGPERSLDDWRDELAQGRLKILEAPGIYFDGSPTGAGKSFADRKVMERAGSSLTLVPTHRNGDELVADLREAGLDAAKLPARASPEAEINYLEGQDKKKFSGKDPPWNYGVCENMPAVEEAEGFGLSPGAAVCPNCPHREKCEFLEEHRIAASASHLVATHHMFAANSEDLAKDRKFLSAHEDAEAMVSSIVEIDPGYLDWVGKVAAEGKALEMQYVCFPVDARLIEAFDVMADNVRALKESVIEANSTTEFVPATTIKLPSQIQRKILEACIALGKRGQISPGEVDSDAMRMMLSLISGKQCSCAIRVSTYLEEGGKSAISKMVIAVSKNEFPESVTILFSDATGSADTIAQLTGRTVHDITPAGYLKPQCPPIQIPTDIKLSTRISKVAKLLGAVMVRHPEARKIGIIGHQSHIEALMSDKSPLGRLTNRVTKTAYFREGKDRASNDWHKECDLLVVLGTPRVPPTAILNQLIRMGDIKSAEQDGQWEDRRWEAETPSGRRRVVKGSGYCNASWQKAHETVVKAALLQAVGRARSNLDDGIPVLVFSNEPLGLPVEDEQEALKPLSENALRSVAWFEEQIAYNLNNSIYTFCNFGTGDMAIAWKQKTDLVSRTLGQLADAGYLTKLAHGRWGVTRLLEQHCP